jgi:hypothetical protein
MSRKVVITAVLILLLLPLGSWFYLRSGLKWRQDAQAVMRGRVPFPEGVYLDQHGQKFSAENLHVSLVLFLPCTSITAYTDVLDKLYAQFRESGKANFILLDSCETRDQYILGTADRAHWYILSCMDSRQLCQQLKDEWPADKPFALVDRKGLIRSYYGIESFDDRKLLTEHMALLLPRERQEKVELKRGSKK